MGSDCRREIESLLTERHDDLSSGRIVPASSGHSVPAISVQLSTVAGIVRPAEPGTLQKVRCVSESVLGGTELELLPALSSAAVSPTASTRQEDWLDRSGTGNGIGRPGIVLLRTRGRAVGCRSSCT